MRGGWRHKGGAGGWVVRVSGWGQGPRCASGGALRRPRPRCGALGRASRLTRRCRFAPRAAAPARPCRSSTGDTQGLSFESHNSHLAVRLALGVDVHSGQIVWPGRVRDDAGHQQNLLGAVFLGCACAAFARARACWLYVMGALMRAWHRAWGRAGWRPRRAQARLHRRTATLSQQALRAPDARMTPPPLQSAPPWGHAPLPQGGRRTPGPPRRRPCPAGPCARPPPNATRHGSTETQQVACNWVRAHLHRPIFLRLQGGGVAGAPFAAGGGHCARR